ncbi:MULTISPECIES: hypothetical protein [unclassified Lysobacter]|uniref:hypothetical protein n=1 Tax=unclassified Lysobacter TaxID=2635362 RepID=UPI001C21C4EF|nr:hypothetical protein [Lysobacter sp. MMG2]MBU8978025.1 hypothetical protein [Lysobacter sp. MMG2]
MNEMGSIDERDKQDTGQQNQGGSQRPDEPAGPIALHNEERRTGISGQLDEEHDSENAEQGEEGKK